MDKLRSVLVTFATNFVIAFAVGSYLRDRRTGVKAGIALGAIAALAAVFLGGKADELEELVEEQIEVEAAAAGE